MEDHQQQQRRKRKTKGAAKTRKQEIKIDEPIYDTVDEDEYQAILAKDFKGFIGDESEEVSYSEEEWEGELEIKKTKREKKNKGPSFEAAMDSIVDDVIAEFAPHENDKEKRRLGNKRSSEKDQILATENIPASLVVCSTLSSNSLHKHGVLEEEKVLLEIPTNGKDLGVVEEPSQVEELKDEELKVEPLVNQADTRTFNIDKIKEEKDPSISATEGLQTTVSSCLNADGKPPFVVNSDGSLPFYVLDAYEELSGSNAGNIYLFGKVKAGTTYHSCCVVVKNMQRCIYAIPIGSIFEDSAIVKLERDVQESKMSSTSFRTKLHEMASGLKANIRKQLLDRNVSNFSMKPVKRSYAFERSDIERKENYVLEISYPFKDPPLPSDLKGETFCALLGTHSRVSYQNSSLQRLTPMEKGLLIQTRLL